MDDVGLTLELERGGGKGSFTGSELIGNSCISDRNNKKLLKRGSND